MRMDDPKSGDLGGMLAFRSAGRKIEGFSQCSRFVFIVDHSQAHISGAFGSTK
jgi:hypothetical protein